MHAHHTNKQVHVPKKQLDKDDCLVVKVCGDGTVKVDVTDKCRVILHTGEVDEATGMERIEIYRELESRSSAIFIARIFNRKSSVGAPKHWAEVLDYDLVYQCARTAN